MAVGCDDGKAEIAVNGKQSYMSPIGRIRSHCVSTFPPLVGAKGTLRSPR